ncbi:hypothetical protein ACKI1K_08525 [Streptomyces scabiei]|uniref:hypothetical protein n=1 Tax=Streptomyces scabiei TaxID=1930 RepID=UPI0038F74A55
MSVMPALHSAPARAIEVAASMAEYRDDNDLVAAFRAALRDWCNEQSWPRLVCATFPATRSTDPDADFFLRAEGATLRFADGSHVALKGHEFGPDVDAALNYLNADGPAYDDGLVLHFEPNTD